MSRKTELFRERRLRRVVGGRTPARACRAADSTTSSRASWTFKHLPVIPPHFDLAPIERSEARLERCCCKLIRRKDVTGLVNACDAGREGELIFRYIVQHAEHEEADRALVAAVDDAASIRDGFREAARGP